MAYINRRRFIQSSSALGFAAGTGALAALGSAPALAADVTGYKALVCVFFKGGMDTVDMVLPVDQPSHDALASVRPGLFSGYGVGSGTSSRDIENILELNADNIGDFGGRRFGLASDMAELHGLFEAGDAAIIGNVGPLIEPTTRDSMELASAKIPERLFSHNDQQSTWMSFGAEGTQTGWGGKFSDAVLASDSVSNPVFASISTSGNDVFLSGETALQFSAPSGSPNSANILRQRWRLGSGRNSDAARATLRDHLAAANMSSANLFEQDIIGVNGRAIENIEIFKSAIENATPVAQSFPNSGLGNQLKTVANTIAARGGLNVRRQVFYVAIGGFDTHDNQRNSMPALQRQISQAVGAFQSAMVELGMTQDVTLFTASDFGRTTIDNGDGTDHGWGSHHFAVGGAVNGRNIYGTLPEYDLGAQTYTASRGRLIPSVSVDQYAASLGSWFGLNTGELGSMLPNLGNFSGQSLDMFSGTV